MSSKNIYHCNLIRSRRRTMSLVVERDGTITIRAPKGISKNHIDKFLNEKKNWIKKKVEQAKEHQLKAEKISGKLNKSLINKYKNHARTHLNERAMYYANNHSLNFNSVRISSATRRWGSCGPTNNLNINWRIIFAPQSVIDYLVVHELAHTKYKNHQKNFWALVSKMHPQYKQGRKWLRENGYLLQVNING